MTHIMLGFEFAGGWKDIKGSVAVTALQFLMGGGGSFSAGGPGAHARLPLHTRCRGLQCGWLGRFTEWSMMVSCCTQQLHCKGRLVVASHGSEPIQQCVPSLEGVAARSTGPFRKVCHDHCALHGACSTPRLLGGCLASPINYTYA